MTVAVAVTLTNAQNYAAGCKQTLELCHLWCFQSGESQKQARAMVVSIAIQLSEYLN